jgi:methylglutamate dehydrogenase subunit D
VFERQSALAGALKLSGRDGADGRRSLRLGEVRGWRLIQLAAFPKAIAEVERAARSLLGVDPPVRGGSAVTADKCLVMRTGPETFWIVSPESEDVAAALQAVVRPDSGAVTPLSYSRARIYIEGVEASRVLSTSIALDFHRSTFRVGHFAMTGLHHTAVLVHRTAEERYELYVLRSFAPWTWEWLTDAALQFGYEIGT